MERSRSITRWGANRGREEMAQLRTKTCIRRIIRYCVRRLRVGLACGRRRTAPATSRTTLFRQRVSRAEEESTAADRVSAAILLHDEREFKNATVFSRL